MKIIDLHTDTLTAIKNDENIVENNNPQKIKPLFKILSAKNPKMGCKSCENN